MNLKDKIQYLKNMNIDCGSNSCRFAFNKGGMRTNGGCRCFENRPQDVKHFAWLCREIVTHLDNELSDVLYGR